MKKIVVFFPFLLLTFSLFSTGCNNISSVPFSANANSAKFSHYIGELFGGGIVAAVWKINGEEHGLIASLNDLSDGIMWSNMDTTLIGISAQSAINGQANTNAILNQTGATVTAAGLCDTYIKGGFSDWYLPSTSEMSQLYNSALQINIVLEADDDSSTKGFEFIKNPYYWTSTEYFNRNSWLQNFLIGTTYNDPKAAPYRVRAVRRY
jgi:Protein of unknown function (DUF1566)